MNNNSLRSAIQIAANSPSGTAIPFGTTPEAEKQAVLTAGAGFAAANKLGSLMGERNGPSSSIPGYEVIARKFFAQLSKAVDLAEVVEACEKIAEQQKIQDEHSPVIQQRKISDATERYAIEPNAKNLETLRHLKTLDYRDHCMAQDYAQRAKLKILAELTPKLLPVFALAKELMESEAQSLANAARGQFEAWQLSPVPSDLECGLASRITEFDGISKSKCAFGHLPEFIAALVEVGAKKAGPKEEPKKKTSKSAKD
jgi:hypothetical protein